MTNIISSLTEYGIHYAENEQLSKYTSFKTGGPCRLMIKPATVDEVKTVFSLLKSSGYPFHIIGNGSNILAPDEPGDDVYICTSEMSDISVTETEDGGIITAGSGAILAKVAYTAYTHGLTGLEFAHGIPGSLGGACVMNAGAYGGQMADVVESTTYLNANGDIVTVKGEEHQFGYRKSVFSANDYIISSSIKLVKGNPSDIKAKMEELAAKRRASQPLEFPSAGSTFKRPEGYFAGKLIEDAGLKGTTIGGAQVSTKHAGFIINIGNASSNDILKLISQVQDVVYKDSGVMLEPEVRIIGRTK